jgi:transposase
VQGPRRPTPHTFIHGATISAQRYEDTLQKLRRAIRLKRPGMISNGIVLLHDNARPHTANSVKNMLQRFIWEVLHHPPYSPDFSSCDFHIIGDLKRDIRGHQFASDEDVCDWVKMWFRRQPTSYFKDGIDCLISQWDKCINSFAGLCF